MTEGATLGSLLFDYWRDAGERSLLFLDILRQRGNDYLVQSARTVPNVLNFEAELVLDGRTLERPVNYVLARIIPQKDVTIDAKEAPLHRLRPARRPWTRHRRHEARQRDRRRAPRRPSLLFRRAFCRAQPGQTSRTSAAPKPSSSKWWSSVIETPTASRFSSAIVRRAGRS